MRARVYPASHDVTVAWTTHVIYGARVEFGRAQFELVTVHFCVCVCWGVRSIPSQSGWPASSVCFGSVLAAPLVSEQVTWWCSNPNRFGRFFFCYAPSRSPWQNTKQRKNNKWKVFYSSVFATLLPAIDRSGSSAVLLCYPNCVPRVAFRTFALLCNRNIKVVVVVAANRGRVVDVSVFRVGYFSKIIIFENWVPFKNKRSERVWDRW